MALKQNMSKLRSQKNAAFTLIELLIACGIFSVVMIVITGTFVSLIDTQKNILLTRKALAQASYALEFMSRALRMAQKDMTPDCLSQAGLNYENFDPGDGNVYHGIRFKNANQNGECQEFYLENGQIKFKRQGQSSLSLTSPDINIERLKFLLRGESQDDTLQPLVTISFEIKLKNSPPLKLQTSISQRNLDVVY
jgi:type II secretory pathway pseudopilin PulG